MSSTQKIINRLLTLESMGEQMRQMAYSTRVELEKLSSPAPSRGNKGLSSEKKVALITNFRKSMLRIPRENGK